ncbi:hypothetical protein BRD04_06045 [Halobacteriales archaeon QS_9_67_17]|nr:MAG: hypothetical protein BRD04_06045 [Halobacteriales archaeon QS_9_67_17]
MMRPGTSSTLYDGTDPRTDCRPRRTLVGAAASVTVFLVAMGAASYPVVAGSAALGAVLARGVRHLKSLVRRCRRADGTKGGCLPLIGHRRAA